jgi:hypothetical protein
LIGCLIRQLGLNVLTSPKHDAVKTADEFIPDSLIEIESPTKPEVLVVVCVHKSKAAPIAERPAEIPF